METWTTLLRLDPFGPAVPALCALLAVALGGVIMGGFALLGRVERAPRERTRGATPRELGLQALWQLGRPTATRATRSVPVSAAALQAHLSSSSHRGAPAATPGESL